LERASFYLWGFYSSFQKTNKSPTFKERAMEKIEQLKKYKVNFTQVSNTVLNDDRISLKAKGLYAYLFSKPDDWVFHVDVMEKELKESKGQLYAIIKELIQFGYIIRKQINENGKFGGIIYEFIENPCAEIPCADFSVYGQTLTHNNTNKEQILINNNTKDNLLSFGELSKVKLTQEEFDKIKESKPDLYEKAIDKLDTWLATTTKKVKKGSHYAYFKSNSWVWEGLTPKNESGILVERGKFFIDDSMKDYKEVLSGMHEKDIDACWEWIMKNKEGQTVSTQWVIDRLNQFKGGIY
jgi:predicted transcriptional regulator